MGPHCVCRLWRGLHRWNMEPSRLQHFRLRHVGELAFIPSRLSLTCFPFRCFNGNNAPPFDKPLDSEKGRVRVDFNYMKAINPATGLTNLTGTFTGTSDVPSSIEFRLCFSDNAFNDRPWRKKNKAYPGLTQNCNGPDEHKLDLLGKVSHSSHSVS